MSPLVRLVFACIFALGLANAAELPATRHESVTPLANAGLKICFGTRGWNCAPGAEYNTPPTLTIASATWDKVTVSLLDDSGRPIVGAVVRFTFDASCVSVDSYYGLTFSNQHPNPHDEQTDSLGMVTAYVLDGTSPPGNPTMTAASS